MNKEQSEERQAAAVSGAVKLNWGKRIAYGCGDTACNIVCGMINALLTLFYTDYAGIPIATVGLVMLISRVFDGSSDIIMGVIVGKTKSKWGKSRPWLLWMAIPYVLCAVAMFTVPQTNATLQFWYIFVTYNLCTTVCYTAINVPYGTLSTMMTRSSHERDVLRWLLGENYKTAEVVFPKTTRNAEGELRDPQIMYLTTESGVRIDVESFVNCRYGYDIKCEVVCEEGSLNLPEPANTMVRSNDSRIIPICHDWSERFIDAYNVEFQEWINACKEGRVDGPSAWDGYVGQVTAKAASKARDTQTVVTIEYDEMPEFYKK